MRDLPKRLMAMANREANEVADAMTDASQRIAEFEAALRDGPYRAVQLIEANGEPDSLHIAAMDLARKQYNRIAELEQELANLKAAEMAYTTK